MGPFPFIGFNQAEINGNFGAEYQYRKEQLNELYLELVSDLTIGAKLFIQINAIKALLEIYNSTPRFANLELQLPRPYVTGIGTESYTLYLRVSQNYEAFATFEFDLTDGIVTAITDSFTGPDQLESATIRPYIAEEINIAKTLSVYNQNGAAIFPDTFTFNQSTGIAERRLLRAYDWSFNQTTNQPQRNAISDLRVIPKTVFQLRELSAIEKAMVSFFLEKPIKESITNDDWNDTNIYLPALPGDWEFNFINVSSSKKQLSVSSAENEISFVIAGINVSDIWYFQRFINPTYTKSNNQTEFQWNIAINSFTGIYGTVLDIMSLVDNNVSDIILYGGNEQYIGETSLITIPFASLDVSTTSYLFADSIETYLNANGFPTTYTTETISGQIVFKFVTTASILEKGIIAFLSYNNSPFSYAEFDGLPPDLASLLSGTEPANPNTGKLYETSYYDYDQCEFGTVENEESFNLIIKSGDSYQINIPSNFIFEPEIGPESSQFPRIGIFNCNDEYFQEIGSLVSPYNKTLQWTIRWSTITNQYESISALRSGLNISGQDIILKSCNEQFIGINTLITIPNASLVLTSTDTAFANSIETYLTTNGFETTWDVPINGVIRFTTTCPFIQENGLVLVVLIPEEIAISFATFGVTANQYQASITIPPLANSNYFIGIFQSYILEGDNYSSLLAISQPLQLDNFETFTQILEYGASENSVIEGFEYINGWLQKIRVPLNGAGQTANSEESIYRNSDGTFQIPQNSTDEVLYLHTDYLDLETQRAMISTTKHPIFVLASQNLSVQGDLEITNTQDFTQNSSFRKLQQMRFQALTQGYQPDNNSCIS